MKTNTQVEEMIGAWTNLQNQFWENCLQSKTRSKKSDWESACRQPLELTRDMLSETLKIQAMLTRDALRLTDQEFIESGSFDQFFESIQNMIDSEIDSEEEILESWFEFTNEFQNQLPAASMYPWANLPLMKPTLTWNRTFNNVMKAWEDATEKTLEVQNEFVSHLMPDKESKTNHRGSGLNRNKSITTNSEKKAA